MEKTDSKMYRNPLSAGNVRNMPCICGSGKKIKKCHGNQYAIEESEKNIVQSLLEGKINKNGEKNEES